MKVKLPPPPPPTPANLMLRKLVSLQSKEKFKSQARKFSGRKLRRSQ
jgi:hypothetical protein